jgi:hypothetical protein
MPISGEKIEEGKRPQTGKSLNFRTFKDDSPLVILFFGVISKGSLLLPSLRPLGQFNKRRGVEYAPGLVRVRGLDPHSVKSQLSDFQRRLTPSHSFFWCHIEGVVVAILALFFPLGQFNKRRGVEYAPGLVRVRGLDPHSVKLGIIGIK